jgi:lysozyme
MTDHIAPDDLQLLASVREGEGLRFVAYADPDSPLGKQLALPMNKRARGWQNLSGAPWTYAYGHTGAEVRKGSKCTRAQAEALLRADMTDVFAVLDQKQPWWRMMSAQRQRVLAEMTYNLGYGRLLGFHRFLADAQAGKFAAAAGEMRASDWAKQVGDQPGQRADRLAEMMEQG